MEFSLVYNAVEACGVSDVEDPTFSRQSAHRWRLGCQSYCAGRALLPRKISFLLEVE
jgi:hypothetical protein